MTSQNLTMACRDCNAHKGPSLTGTDPKAQKCVCPFNPRIDRWSNLRLKPWLSPHSSVTT